MKGIHSRMKDQAGFQMISITLDPEYDDVDRLRAYKVLLGVGETLN